jgi:general secretion pathway protein K
MSSKGRQKGVALIVVLWTIALLSLMVGSASRAARIEGRSASFHGTDVQAAVIAESGIWSALSAMLSNEPISQASYTFAVAEGTAEVRVQPVSARINLNTTDASTLKSLLDGSELTAAQRTTLIARIVDWRDATEERGVALDGRMKNAPFYTVDELRQIPGLDEATYRQIAPFLTVFGGDAGLDLRFASDELVRALGVVPQQPASGGHQAERLPSVGVMSISALGVIGDVRAHVAAVVYLTGRPSPPYEILSWHDAVPGSLEH